MLKLTPEILQKIAPKAKKANTLTYVPLLNKYAEENEVNTPVRFAAFLANILHESDSLNATVENLNYGADGLRKTWPTRFTKAQALQYERKPSAIANKVYANRLGNGTEKSGDGYKYRGRGLIQTTGKKNYTLLSKSLFDNNTLVDKPELLQQPEYAVRSAFYFWDSNNLNKLADKLEPLRPVSDKESKEAFEDLTRGVNGGTNGLDDRIAFYNKIIRHIF